MMFPSCPRVCAKANEALQFDPDEVKLQPAHITQDREQSMADVEGAEQDPMHRLLLHFQRSLKAFASSSETFQVVRSAPQASSGPDVASTRTLYVLDSSFNPPTLAHLQIASSAVESDARGDSPKRLLLLLATQNADKPSKPAPFEHRLVMMTQFAEDLRSHLAKAGAATKGEADKVPTIDVGITKKPYFHDKATAIAESNLYPLAEQVHLTGFDTIVRIFDTKYYPPDHTLAPLDPFLSKHRLRVTMRPDDGFGDSAEQEGYIESIARGEREKEGGRKGWAKRIDLVEGKKPDEIAVSSTKAREAVKTDRSSLDGLVTPGVRDWILSNGLYTEEEDGSRS